MARVSLEPLRGFRDILHPESTALSRLARVFAEEAERHGYLEVKPPTLERFELFALKSGEEIRRSMYVFRDKAGREVALRPEATASIARIYLKHLRGEPKPLRLYYIVNCFRYEEPQRARYREFWQAGVERLGTPGIEADFEVIKLLLRFYERIGMLDKIVLKIGNTRIYRRLFSDYGVPEEVQDRILHLMDKGLYGEAAEEARRAAGEELAGLLERLWERRGDAKAALDILSGHPGAAEAVEELTSLVEMLSSYRRDAKLELDLAFARGLAYYTGVIFEVKVPGFPVSIAGGGRYDSLVAIYGDEQVPGTGFAIGLDRTLAAMQDLGHQPALLYQEPPRAAVVALSEKLLPLAARVQDALTGAGIAATIEREKRLQKLLPKLARRGYRYAAIIGEREASENTVVLRDLERRVQARVPLEKLLAATSVETVESLLEGQQGGEE